MEGRADVEDYEQLARSAPSEALEQLDATLADSSVSPGDRVRLLRHAALAARAVRDLDRSNELLDKALRQAERIDDTEGMAWLQVTKAYNISLVGDHGAALELIRSVDSGDSRHLATVVKFQEATILGRLGRYREAVDALTLADQVGFMDDGGFHQSQLLKNRGVFRAHDGQYVDATADLEAARDLAATLGLDFEVAFCEHNLGLAASLVGDLPLAFAKFELAEERIRALSGSDFESKASHCKALMIAGLFGEAAEMAHLAASDCDEAGFHVDGAEIRLVEATALLELERFDEASTCAGRARGAYEANGSESLAAAAEVMQLAADHRSGHSIDLTALQRCIGHLEAHGRHRDAIEAKLLSAAGELDYGAATKAESILASIRSEVAKESTDLRLAAAAVEAEMLWREGSSKAAAGVAKAGMILLAEQQSLLGTSELRAGVRRHAKRLGSIGMSIAVSSGDPFAVFDWQDRVALTAYTPVAVRPPRTPEMRGALARFRSAGDNEDRQDLEERIRGLDRTIRGVEQPPLQPASMARLTSELGDAAVVSYAELDGRLIAVRLAAGEVKLRDVGPAAEVERIARAVRSDLRSRLVTARTSRAQRIRSGLTRLDELLFDGASLNGQPPEIIVLPPQLVALPWSQLPTLAGHPIVVATSASAWSATRPVDLDGPVVFAAGPDLRYARAEAERLSSASASSAEQLTGTDAAVDSVLEAIDGASVAHIVAHGTVRTDNPLFSSLRMADGELSVYELAELTQAPSLVVLSACHVGLPAEAPGQELLGMVTGFLNAGTSCVLASTLPVPDNESTIDMMTRFHRFLGEGMSPGVAWAEVQRTCRDEEQLLDAATFTVFGRG